MVEELAEWRGGTSPPGLFTITAIESLVHEDGERGIEVSPGREGHFEAPVLHCPDQSARQHPHYAEKCYHVRGHPL